jgi:hypothetical protein
MGAQATFCRAKPGSLAAFDVRFAPFYVTTFRGTIELETAKWHAEVARPFFETSVREGRPVFYITDAREMVTPSPTVRQFWATQMSERRRTTERFVGTYVVLDSVFLKGALTAIQWLMDQPDKINYVTTLDAAFNEGFNRLKQSGHRLPDIDAARYEPPSPDPETKSGLSRVVSGRA